MLELVGRLCCSSLSVDKAGRAGWSTWLVFVVARAGLPNCLVKLAQQAGWSSWMAEVVGWSMQLVVFFVGRVGAWEDIQTHISWSVELVRA